MADITVAASEDAFQEFFNHVRDNFSFARSGSESVGPFAAGYDIDIRLKDGAVLVIPAIYGRAMSIDTTILIAGEPVLVLAEGLKSLEFNVVDGEHVRLMPRVRPEGDAAWRRAVEYHTGQPFTPTGSAEVQRRQSDAFLLVLKELVATLQPSGGQR
ncbi:MAG: hypothetical protein GY720_00800 [bacterium]|nr:hypothetical protein [bacterium]